MDRDNAAFYFDTEFEIWEKSGQRNQGLSQK